MSERASAPESNSRIDRLLAFSEKWNNVSATVLTGAGVALVYVGAESLGLAAVGLAVADVAAGGLVKSVRGMKGSRASPA